MIVPFRTFALFGLALGMLGVGYLLGPAPGATTLPTQPVAKAIPAAPQKPATTLVATRPPVPLVTQTRASYVTDRPAGAFGPDKPTVNMGTFAGNPPDPNDKTQALAVQPPAKSGDDAQAKKAIEFDGYKNVRGLTKGADGMWRGRAMRGHTEIAISVDANGNVSAQ